MEEGGGSGGRRPTLTMVLVVALTIAILTLAAISWVREGVRSVGHRTPSVPGAPLSRLNRTQLGETTASMSRELSSGKAAHSPSPIVSDTPSSGPVM